jgi:hypothetical protein
MTKNKIKIFHYCLACLAFCLLIALQGCTKQEELPSEARAIPAQSNQQVITLPQTEAAQQNQAEKSQTSAQSENTEQETKPLTDEERGKLIRSLVGRSDWENSEEYHELSAHADETLRYLITYFYNVYFSDSDLLKAAWDETGEIQTSLLVFRKLLGDEDMAANGDAPYIWFQKWMIRSLKRIETQPYEEIKKQYPASAIALDVFGYRQETHFYDFNGMNYDEKSRYIRDHFTQDELVSFILKNTYQNPKLWFGIYSDRVEWCLRNEKEMLYVEFTGYYYPAHEEAAPVWLQRLAINLETREVRTETVSRSAIKESETPVMQSWIFATFPFQEP